MATQIPTITPEELHAAQLRGDQPALLDVRTAAEYRAGHIPGAQLLPDRVFTGDTLLIRGTGRTDFQNGDPAAQYDSLFGKLLKMPEDTFVYPAHDYNGMTVSTIGEEKRHNPRLQVSGKQAYIDQMNALELDDPRVMDIAVPANRACGVLNAA